MSYWAAARLQPHREAVALHFLKLHGYTTYLPRLSELRVRHGRRITCTPPLFPGYAFVAIELQWHTARWAFGVIGLIMDGVMPARVPDNVIAEIRGRERNGLVVLPKPPQPSSLQPGTPVKIVHGPFAGVSGLFAGMKPNERVEVLLQLLGRVTLPKRDVVTVPGGAGTTPP
jgi:transcriptional antiterminator RfaH